MRPNVDVIGTVSLLWEDEDGGVVTAVVRLTGQITSIVKREKQPGDVTNTAVYDVGVTTNLKLITSSPVGASTLNKVAGIT